MLPKHSALAMKPVEFIPPVVALAAAALWLGSQSRSISSLVEENTVLRERLEAARHPAASGEEAADSLGYSRTANGKAKKIEWKQLALRIAETRGDVADMRANIEVQRLLMELSPEELLAALDEIATMDLTDEAKRHLEITLFGALSEKDPALAVQRSSDRLTQEGVSWQISNAFRTWAMKDPTAAAAWMDKQIADGKFESKTLDGKSEVRMRFEAGLVGALLESDPGAAAARVGSLPENERSSIFTQGMSFRVKVGNEKAIADLIRTTVPEGERTSTLANTGGQLVHQGGYERVGNFLTSIGASKDEREAIVSRALQNKMSRLPQVPEKRVENFEESRAWAAKEAPEALNRLTGEALGNMAARSKYDDAAKLAVKYHEESGNDDVMIAFLSSHGSAMNPDSALGLVDKISDEAKRAEIKKQIEDKKGNPRRSTR